MSDEYKKLSTFSKSRLWGGVAFGVGLFVGIVVGQFERVAVAEAAGWSVGVIVFAGWVFWSERRWQWFWYFMAAVIVAHVAAIVAVPWPLNHKWAGADGWIGVGDLILTSAAGEAIGHIARRLRERRLNAGAFGP